MMNGTLSPQGSNVYKFGNVSFGGGAFHDQALYCLDYAASHTRISELSHSVTSITRSLYHVFVSITSWAAMVFAVMETSSFSLLLSKIAIWMYSGCYS